MTPSALASRYARALVDVVLGGPSGSEPQQVLRELRSFESTLASSAALRNALSSPAVAPTRKRAVVRRIADTLLLSRIARNFLLVLVDHRRVPLLSEVLASFEIQLDERLGFARAEVSAAQDLDERQRAALTGELERLTGKRLRSKFSVDESLIGGVLARLGSTVYDGSVRGQLENLGRRLAAE